jgi:fluoroacetyl-CoA thioesterase
MPATAGRTATFRPCPAGNETPPPRTRTIAVGNAILALPPIDPPVLQVEGSCGASIFFKRQLTHAPSSAMFAQSPFAKHSGTLHMQPVEPGLVHSFTIATELCHSAEAFGNSGVLVLGTPALIGFIETAAERCVHAYYDPNEASLGIGLHVRHVAPAPAGAVVEARARLIDVSRRKLGFEVEVAWRDTILLIGTHDRAVVDLRDFLNRAGFVALRPITESAA